MYQYFFFKIVSLTTSRLTKPQASKVLRPGEELVNKCIINECREWNFRMFWGCFAGLEKGWCLSGAKDGVLQSLSYSLNTSYRAGLNADH